MYAPRMHLVSSTIDAVLSGLIVGGLAVAIVVASVVMFVGALVLVPIVAIRLPADYFAHHRRERRRLDGYPQVIRIALLALANVLGYVFILAGIAMLVLPGQGVLTILIGVMLADFPGKYRLERWLVTRGPVLNSLNWLRGRAGKPPLVIDED
jgi:archaellum biogenesis protein FlaJ (TadC family)